jgi:hypothetical protein
MALAEYGNALNIDTDGSGNPILVDPDSGDTIAIYDRASGGWQVTEIEAATGDFDSVNTEEVSSGGWGYPTTGPSKKPPLASKGDMEIYVDPDAGSDSNPGTQAEPIASIAEACARIPKRINHKIRVYLKYSTNYGGGYLFQHHTIPSSQFGIQFVGHDPENPYYDAGKSRQDIKTAGWQSGGNIGSEHIKVKGFTIDGVWQSLGDLHLYFKNMRFINGSLTNNNVLNVKGGGSAILAGCHIQDCGTALRVEQCSDITVKDTTSTNIGNRPYNVVNGSRLSLEGSDTKQLIDNSQNVGNTDGTAIILSDADVGHGLTATPDGNYTFQNDLTASGGLVVDGATMDVEEENIDFNAADGTEILQFVIASGEFFVQGDTPHFDAGLTLDRNETDLSTETGNRNGEMRLNDGTTGSNEPYWWDDSAGVWRSLSDRTTTI